MTASNSDLMRLYYSDKWYFGKFEAERGTSQIQEARNDDRKFGGLGSFLLNYLEFSITQAQSYCL